MAQFNKNTQAFLNQERTLFEVPLLATKDGNVVDNYNRLPVSINSDAFGRTRISQPLTLFDSSHRYRDNNLWETGITGTASATFSVTEGLVNLTVDNASGAQVIRETTKVFSYQPGKSLLVMNTFVPATPQENLRQRVGYFGADK